MLVDFPFFPVNPEEVEDLIPELPLPALDLAPRLAAPDLDEPRAHVASEDLRALAGLLLVDLLLPYCWLSRLGGLHTSGSSKGTLDEVGYSSNGWKTKDFVGSGGDEDLLDPEISLKALISASNCFTISISSEMAFLQLDHFVRITTSSRAFKCLREINTFFVQNKNFV